jgi:NADPH:quinone reductase-like Zn-dependent oxidoreductase
MRAMALVGSFGLDHLKLIERPMPEPRHNEVVIRMAAVSYRDMDMVLGDCRFGPAAIG